MTRHLVLPVLSLLLLSATGRAQTATHPCDVVVPANPIVTKANLSVGFCATGLDLAGNATTVTAIKVVLDGVVVLTGPLPSPIGSPSATGFSYYETLPVIFVARGAHSVAVSLIDRDGESAPSATFPFSATGPGPQPAVSVRVR